MGKYKIAGPSVERLTETEFQQLQNGMDQATVTIKIAEVETEPTQLAAGLYQRLYIIQTHNYKHVGLDDPLRPMILQVVHEHSGLPQESIKKYHSHIMPPDDTVPLEQRPDPKPVIILSTLRSLEQTGPDTTIHVIMDRQNRQIMEPQYHKILEPGKVDEVGPGETIDTSIVARERVI
jgi:hypothetical protein